MRARIQKAAFPLAAGSTSLLLEAAVCAVTGSAFLWLLIQGVIQPLAVLLFELYLSF